MTAAADLREALPSIGEHPGTGQPPGRPDKAAAVDPIHRRTFIGGSDAASVLGVSPWKTPLQLYMEKIGEAGPVADNAPMLWGRVLETPIAEEYARRTGKRVRRVNRDLRHQKFAYIVGHIDRDVVGESRILEVKTSRSDQGWGEPGSDDIPMHYQAQAQHYLAVTGAEACDVALLIAGSDFRIYTVPRHDELIGMLIEAENEFWDRVQRRDPPAPVNAADAAIRWVRSVSRTDKTTLEVAAAVDKLRAVKARIKDLEVEEESLRGAILPAFTDAEALEFDGKVIATWKSQAVRRLDQKALAGAHPDIVEQFTKTSEQRVLRLAKP